MKKHFLMVAGKQTTALPMKIFASPAPIRSFSSELGWKIFTELSEPSCPMDIARKLGVHEQKVYYYIRKLKKANMLRDAGEEQRKGTVARFYQLKDFAFGVALKNVPDELELNISSPLYAKHLEPFVAKGVLDARIIVGSPDPHGPWKSRGSDSFCAIDFALFLGAYTNGRNVPNYRLDTEVRESDLTGNLILFGGPTVNMVTARINDLLPIFHEVTDDYRRIKSKLSGNVYKGDDVGMISIIDSPFDNGKKILVFAGKRFQGTRCAVLAWIKNLDEIMSGNKHNPEVIAKVVRGYDMDGDGIIDSAEFLE